MFGPRRERGSVPRVVLVVALACLMGWGSIPAPALAQMAEEAVAEEAVNSAEAGNQAEAGDDTEADGNVEGASSASAESSNSAEANGNADADGDEDAGDATEPGDADESDDGTPADGVPAESEEPLDEVGPIAAQAEDGGQGDDENGLAPSAQSAPMSNPRVVANGEMQAKQLATWDCVWFGSYPQTEVTSADSVYESLESASWDANGDATVGGARYRRISAADATSLTNWPDGSPTYRYFRYEPIKWRVLQVSGSTALVLADFALDDQVYNVGGEGATWERSSMRSWLNGYGAAQNQPGIDFSGKNFIDAAFNSIEKAAILTDNGDGAGNAGSLTWIDDYVRDKVFLLSEPEAHAQAFGFAMQSITLDEARKCEATDFAEAMGTIETNYEGVITVPAQEGEDVMVPNVADGEGGASDKHCDWWLRPPNETSNGPTEATLDGMIFGFSLKSDSESNGMRPAMRINTSSPSVNPAGTVSSDKTVDEVPVPEGYGAAIDLSGATIASIKGRGYDGKPYEPKPKVMLDGVTLREGRDFEFSYRNNVSASKEGSPAVLIVTGKGHYKGTASAGFEVWRNGQPMTAWAVARKAPVASLKSRDVTVEAPIHVAHAVSAGQPMEYRKVGGDSRLNVDVATGRVTVRKGTPAGTYRVTIRAIAHGGANYADGSRTVDCKVQVVAGAKIDQDFQVIASDVTRTAASLASADYLTRPFSVALAAGGVTYKRAGGSGCLDVDTMGRLKIARGTRAGTYYVKVWATAAGDAGYNPCTRTVTVKVVVK